MKIKQGIILTSCMIFSGIASSESPTNIEYVNIKSKTDITKCLTLSGDGSSLELNTCNNSKYQGWRITNNHYIHNQSDSDENKCLMAFSGAQLVTYDLCYDDEYSSMRTWYKEINSDGSITFQNDAPLYHTLNVDLNDNSIYMHEAPEDEAGKWFEDKLAYQPITNSAMGDNLCLTLQPNHSNVTFAECNNSDEQSWKFNTNFIHNRANESKCLLISWNGTTVNYGTCSGWGYTSMRTWYKTLNANGAFTITNKYNRDLGRRDSLTANLSNSSISMSTPEDLTTTQWYYNAETKTATYPTLGTKKVLLIATHYNGHQPNDPDAIYEAVFGEGQSLKNYVATASHGKLHLDGTFLSDINLGDKPSSCSASSILDKARAAAREQGIEPNNYNYLFVDITRSSCGWEGLAAMPGNWILSNGVGYKPWLWSHEFGHNLGYKHSYSIVNCPVEEGIVQLGSQCTTGGSADSTDTMGGGGIRLFPVNYHYHSGWLDDTTMPVINNSGNYRISTLWRENKEGSQGYRIKRKDGSELTFEYRQPQELFDTWSLTDPYVNGVIVRTKQTSGKLITSYIVDTTPSSNQGTKDAPLTVGKSIYDKLSGSTITVLEADESGATIEVILDQ